MGNNLKSAQEGTVVGIRGGQQKIDFFTIGYRVVQRQGKNPGDGFRLFNAEISEILLVIDQGKCDTKSFK